MAGKFHQTKDGFVIDRAGRVLFIPVKSDGTLDYANAIRSTAGINTITATNSKTKTAIPNGNDMYALGDRVTEIVGTVAIEFSTIDPAIWGMAAGSGLKEVAQDTMTKIYDYMKIDENGKITLPDVYKENGYINVLGSDGTAFEKVTDGAAEVGEYTVAAASQGTGTELTFSEADKGKNVAITMESTKATVSYAQGKKSMRYHKLIIDSEVSTVNEAERMALNIEVSQVSLTGDMVEALQKDPSALKTLTFSMYAPLPGEDPYKVKIETKTAE